MTIGWQEAILLVPFVLLMLWALIDVIRRPESEMRRLPKWAWLLIVLVGSTAGQIAYLALGRVSKRERPVATDVRTAGPDPDAIDRLYGPSTGGER